MRCWVLVLPQDTCAQPTMPANIVSIKVAHRRKHSLVEKERSHPLGNDDVYFFWQRKLRQVEQAKSTDTALNSWRMSACAPSSWAGVWRPRQG
eukprot:scaffold205222_cov33-Tisochrysis_lutea.AAC.2